MASMMTGWTRMTGWTAVEQKVFTATASLATEDVDVAIAETEAAESEDAATDEAQFRLSQHHTSTNKPPLSD